MTDSIRITKYGNSQQSMEGQTTGIINLYDEAGKHVANLIFVRGGTLPGAIQDAAGLVLIHLWENAFPVVIDMLRSGAQVFLRLDGTTGSISTSLQAIG
jgi:hypothetical protein